MSKNKDTLDTQSSNTISSKKPITISKESVVEVAKTHTGLDSVLWVLAILALIASTLVGEYLPRYWAQANDIWTQIGITVALVVFAFACLALTHQGRAFKTLLKDAGIELRRVTWPSKDETIKYTWQVILVMIIVGLMVWLLDMFFSYVVGFII